MDNSLKIILYIFPIALCFDIIITFLLAPFYKGYNHLTQVMSLLGNHRFSLHSIYNIWLVILGVVILIGSIQLQNITANISRQLSILLVIILFIYAIGGCILSGLFSVEDSKLLDTISAKIHGFGSVIGFMTLIFAALIISIYFYKTKAIVLCIISIVCFLLSIIFFCLFVMADKPTFANTIISLEGLWQRLSLSSMYIPIILLCIKNI